MALNKSVRKSNNQMETETRTINFPVTGHSYSSTTGPAAGRQLEKEKAPRNRDRAKHKSIPKALCQSPRRDSGATLSIEMAPVMSRRLSSSSEDGSQEHVRGAIKTRPMRATATDLSADVATMQLLVTTMDGVQGPSCLPRRTWSGPRCRRRR